MSRGEERRGEARRRVRSRRRRIVFTKYLTSLVIKAPCARSHRLHPHSVSTRTHTHQQQQQPQHLTRPLVRLEPLLRETGIECYARDDE